MTWSSNKMVFLQMTILLRTFLGNHFHSARLRKVDDFHAPLRTWYLQIFISGILWIKKVYTEKKINKPLLAYKNPSPTMSGVNIVSYNTRFITPRSTTWSDLVSNTHPLRNNPIRDLTILISWVITWPTWCIPTALIDVFATKDVNGVLVVS